MSATSGTSQPAARTPRGDVLQVRGVAPGLRGDPHDLAAGLCQLQRLLHAGLSVAGVEVSIDCTRMGLSPPMAMPPTVTTRLSRR